MPQTFQQTGAKTHRGQRMLRSRKPSDGFQRELHMNKYAAKRHVEALTCAAKVQT